MYKRQNDNNLLYVKNDHASSVNTACAKFSNDAYGSAAACLVLEQAGQANDSQWINFHDIDAMAWQFRKSADVDDSDADANFQICNGSTTETMLFHQDAAAVTMSTQPAFSAHPASTQSNLATTAVTIVLGTEIFDQGSNFASNTFTAPVTGKYQLNVVIRFDALDSASSYYQLYLVTSNRSYYSIMDPDFGQDAGMWLSLIHI